MKEKPLTIYHKNGHFTPDPTGVRTKEAIAQPFPPDALQPVHADKDTPLILKDERMGTLLCVDTGDVNGDGLQEIVVGSSTGAVALFDNHGQLLWRYTHPIPSPPIIVANLVSGALFPKDYTEIMPLYRPAAIKSLKICSLMGERCILGIANQGAFVLDSAGKINWRCDGAQTSPYVDNTIVLLKKKMGVDKILVLLEQPLLLDTNGTIMQRIDAPHPITIANEDIDDDGENEFVILSHSHLYAFRRTGELLWSLAAEDYGYSEFFNALVVEDINSDGIKEILVGSFDVLTAFSNTGTRLWECGEYDEYVANIEIVTVNGQRKILTDGIRLINSNGKLERTLTCQHDTAEIRAADIDNDGEQELIIGGCHKQVLSVMKLSGSSLWQYYVGGDVRGLKIADINNDGFLEIIIASEDLHVLSHTGELLWRYRSGGVVKVQAADVDRDGRIEIIATSSALCAYSGDGTAKWGRHIAHGWRTAIKTDKIVVGCRDELMYLFDGAGDVLWTQELDSYAAPSAIFDDINGDGESEILTFTEKIYLYTQSGDLIWKQPCSTSARTTAKVRGRHEKIIVLGGLLEGRRNDGWVFALDASGKMLWKYRYWPEDRKEAWEEKWAPMDFSDFVAIDLNGDGSDEIVCASTSRWLTSHASKWRERSSRVGTLHCLTVTGELLWKAKLTAYSPSSTALRRNLLLAADLNGDGEVQIISGCHGLAVFRSDGQEIWGRPCSGPIWEVAAGDVNGDGKQEVVVAADAVEVFSATGERLMEYVGLEGPKTVALADIDSDGIQEIIVGAEGIFVLKLC